MMNKKGYNKYGEYVGKKILTKKQVEQDVFWGSVGDVFATLLVSVVLLPLLILAIIYSVDSLKVIAENADVLLKYEQLGIKLMHTVNLVIAIVLGVTLVVGSALSLIKAVKLKKGEYLVDVDDVNYLDVRVVRRRRSSRELLVVHFYKHGRYNTEIPFNNEFAEQKEKFYVVVTKEDKPKILNIYRCSKYEYQE